MELLRPAGRTSPRCWSRPQLVVGLVADAPWFRRQTGARRRALTDPDRQIAPEQNGL